MAQKDILPQGAIRKLVGAPEEEVMNYAPNLQVLAIKKTKDEKYKYMITISDGLLTYEDCRSGEAVAQMIDRNEITEFAIIRMINYIRRKHENGKVTFILQKVVVIKKVERKIGTPSLLNLNVPRPPSKNPGMKFDGSGENEPGMLRVKKDICRLQNALVRLREMPETSSEMGICIQDTVLEYEQAKAWNCSNYKEIADKVTEIVNKFNPIFSDYYVQVRDKSGYETYIQALVKVRLMLQKAQDDGYPGLDKTEGLDAFDEADILRKFELFNQQAGEFASHKCVGCSKLFSGYTEKYLDENGAIGIYPSTRPTLVSIAPKHKFRMEKVCSVNCDKIRVTKEVELLRNNGIRMTTKDLQWNLCQVCFLEKKLKKCGHCEQAYYCSKACQDKHWPKHKDKCSTLKQMNDHYNSRLTSSRTSGDIKSLEQQMDSN